MSNISRFIRKAVTLAKNAVGGRGEATTSEWGGGFTDYAVVFLHCQRVYLGESYRAALDWLSEMPHILAKIGLKTDELLDHSSLVKAFARWTMAVWRGLLCRKAQKHDPSIDAAIDSTYFTLESPSKHYCRRTNYRVQTLKTTALVDTDSQAVLDVQCTTEKRHDTQIGWQVALRNAGDLHSPAADKGYDWQELREKLREKGVRPLTKHRDYGQRALSETVFSSIKRTFGHAHRSRAWTLNSAKVS